MGPVYSGLAAGDYTVIAVNNDTNCESAPVLITITDFVGPDDTESPVIQIGFPAFYTIGGGSKT